MNVGATILDRYRVERRLGVDAEDGSPFLVLDLDEGGARRVLREASADEAEEAMVRRGLRLQGVAEVLAVERLDAERLVVVSRYVEGVELGATAGLDEDARIDLLHQVVLALAALHGRGLAHGDLKPSNVIVTIDRRAVLIDPSGGRGGRRATLHYLAPERIPFGPPTPLADLFAFGVMLYETLAGQPPYSGDSPVEVLRAILRGAPPPPRDGSDELVHLCQSLLARDPALRPGTAHAVADAIERARGRPVAARAAPSYCDALNGTRPEPPGDVDRALGRYLVDARSRRGGGTPLLIAGGPGSGRTTVLERLRDRALVEGFACVSLGAHARASLARAVDTLGGAATLDPVEALGRVARDVPVLVLIDDFDRVDDEAVVLVRDVITAARPRAARLGVVVAGDRDSMHLRLPRGSVSADATILLAPLGEADVVLHLKRALPTLVAPEALAAKVQRWSGGHPSTAMALLSRFADAGGFLPSGSALIADLGRFDDQPAVDAEDGAGRLDALDEPSRELVAVLSRSTVPLASSEIALVVGRGAADVSASLNRLANRRILRRVAGGRPTFDFVFPHDRDGVRARTRLADDRSIRLARALVRRREGSPDVDEAVARLLGAARWRSAGRFFVRAARARFGLGEHREAAEDLERAILIRPRLGEDESVRVLRARTLALSGEVEAADRALAEAIDGATGAAARDLILDRAHLMERAGRPHDALAILDDALRRPDLGHVRPLRAARAWTLFASGRAEDAHAAIDELLATDDACDATAEFLEVHAVASALLHRRGDLRGARRSAVFARRAARALARPSRAAHFDATLGYFDVEAGFEARGLVRVRRAVDSLERAGDTRLLPDALVRYGFLMLRHGDAADALDAFRRAVLLFSRAQNLRGLGWARNGEGSALLRLGDPAAAAARFEESVEDRIAANAHPGAALSAVNLFLARRLRGDADRAREAALRALLLSVGPGRETARIQLYVALAETAAEERDTRRLYGYARRALRLVESTGLDDQRAAALVLVGEGRLFHGDVRGALLDARAARHVARRAGVVDDLARATALRAAALLVRGRPLDARRAHETAKRLARDPGIAVVVRLVYARAALVAVSSGAFGEARFAAEAAGDAGATAAQRGDRLRQGEASALVSALEIARGRGEGDGFDARGRALRQVLEASRWINEAVSVKDVLNRIIDAALRLTRGNRGFVVVRDDENGGLSFAAARNLRREDILDPALQLSRSIVEDVLLSGRTVVTSEARTDERFRAFRSISHLDLLSVMCAPLITRGSTLGAIYVDDPSRVDRFDEAAREVLEALAEHAATALDKARLLTQIEALNRRLARDLEQARRDLDERLPPQRIVTRDPRMLQILELIERVADSDAPVLIEGAAGTGKELIARALHDSSYRRRRPFVPVNSASLPEALVESELFGYKKGAFSGALRDREGLIAAADGGTLFLDEIGEMPPAIQAKLLRVLQDGEYVPLGSNVPETAHVRLVSATHRSLKDLIRAGAFREDLYYRVRVVQIDVPPLRARRGDVPVLVRHFTEKIAAKSGDRPRAFTGAALEALAARPWPGNVRELEAVIRSLVLTVQADVIDVADLPADLLSVARAVAATEGDLPPLKSAVDEREREMVVEALRRCSDNRVRAAAMLGITRRWLLKLIEKHGL